MLNTYPHFSQLEMVQLDVDLAMIKLLRRNSTIVIDDTLRDVYFTMVTGLRDNWGSYPAEQYDPLIRRFVRRTIEHRLGDIVSRVISFGDVTSWFLPSRIYQAVKQVQRGADHIGDNASVRGLLNAIKAHHIPEEEDPTDIIAITPGDVEQVCYAITGHRMADMLFYDGTMEESRLSSDMLDNFEALILFSLALRHRFLYDEYKPVIKSRANEITSDLAGYYGYLSPLAALCADFCKFQFNFRVYSAPHVQSTLENNNKVSHTYNTNIQDEDVLAYLNRYAKLTELANRRSCHIKYKDADAQMENE